MIHLVFSASNKLTFLNVLNEYESVEDNIGNTAQSGLFDHP